jgi:hypothetical protein
MVWGRVTLEEVRRSEVAVSDALLFHTADLGSDLLAAGASTMRPH